MQHHLAFVLQCPGNFKNLCLLVTLYTQIGSDRRDPKSTIMYCTEHIHTHSNVCLLFLVPNAGVDVLGAVQALAVAAGGSEVWPHFVIAQLAIAAMRARFRTCWRCSTSHPKMK